MMKDVEKTIIHAAETLFSKKGFAATSIRDIAKAVDMTSASLYYYMDNKKDLLDMIMRSYLNRLIIGAKGIIRSSKRSNPEEQLKILIQHHITMNGRHKLAALVAATEYRSLEGHCKVEIQRLRSSYVDLWIHVLKIGRERGIFQFENERSTVFALLSLCTGVAHWYRPDGPLTISEIAEQYATFGIKMVTKE